MKRILMIVVIIFLVACGEEIEVHENVDKDLATDSMQVIEILEKAISDREQPSKDDQAVLDEYIKKYGFKYDEGSLEKINNDIYVFVESGINTLDRQITLDSGKQYIKDLKTSVTNFIEDGDTVTNTYSE